MIYLLHGENIVAIRNFLIKLSEDNKVKVRHDIRIEETEPSELLNYISSFDMFSNSTLIAFDVSKMARMNVDSYISEIKKVPNEITFVIYSSKELTKSNAFMKSALELKARVMPFKKVGLSNIFKFCDAVFARDRNQAYKELRNLLMDGEDSIYMLVMLTSSLRNLAYAKFNSREYEKLMPFIKSKVKSQSQKFTEQEIKDLYEKFYTLDVAMKSGLVSHDQVPVLALESVFKSGM